MGDRRRTERIVHARPRGSRRNAHRMRASRAVILAVPTLVVLVTAVALAGGALGPSPATSPSPGLLVHAAVRTLPAASPEPQPTTGPAATDVPVGPGSPAPTGSGAAPGPLLAGYRWPLAHGRITTPFGVVVGGSFIVDGHPVHDGLDIASFCGDPIHAAHDGTVIAKGRHVDGFLGWLGDVAGYEARLTAKDLWGSRAIIVVIDDGNGYRSLYVHLARSSVAVGQHVVAGDVIGYEGATGFATGCHLHYSLFSPTDPGVFPSDPSLVKRLELPAAEVARIDPLAVFPSISTVKVTWGWGVKPSPLPSPTPSPLVAPA
jgi:murein DD-endopeptidase MepM/ murein hydrolase activator NlpD